MKADIEILNDNWGKNGSGAWTKRTDFRYVMDYAAYEPRIDNTYGFANKEQIISFLCYTCQNGGRRQKGNITRLKIFYSPSEENDAWPSCVDFLDLIEFVREFRRFAEHEESMPVQELLFRLEKLAEKEIRLQLEGCK